MAETEMPGVPEFETERLILRGVTEADAPAYQRHFADYAVIREMTQRVPWPYPDDGALDHIRTKILPFQGRDKWVWALFLKTKDREAIGCVDLWRPGTPENRGFWLAHAHWGQGYMTEAVTRVMDYAFDDLGFETLVFANAAGNLRSRRVKEKTGARLIRTEPASYVDPQYTEREVWELRKDEWKSARAKS